MQASGHNVVSSGWDAKLILWNSESGKKVSEFQWENYVNAMAWLNKEKLQVIAAGKSGNMIIVQF